MGIKSKPENVVARFLKNKNAKPFIAKIEALYPSFSFQMCRAIASVVYYRRTTSYKRYYAPEAWCKECEQRAIQLGQYTMRNMKWHEIPVDLKSLQSIRVFTIMKYVDMIKVLK